MTRIARPIAAASSITLLALASLLADAAATSQPAASWSFDEGSGATAADEVGNLDGTIDGATWIPDGAVGTALRFRDDRVTVPDSPTLTSAALGVRLWLRGDPDAPPADGQVILEKGDLDCGGGSYALVVAGGSVAVRYREGVAPGGTQTLTMGTTALPSLWDGAWHQVAFSTLNGEWGHVSVYQQGWMAGTSPAGHAIVHEGLDASSLVIGGPVNAACGTSGFTGDIDEVSVHPRVIPWDELAAVEPTVPTEIEVEDVDPLTVDRPATARVRISPTPLARGRLSAWLTGEDGVERLVGAVELYGTWQIPADGRLRAPIRPEDGGRSVLKLRWQPSLPQLGTETSVAVDVAKAWSGSTLSMHSTYIAGEVIEVGVGVSTTAYVKVNGTVELYERTGDGTKLLDSAPVISPIGSFDGGATFSLPSRSAGPIELEARFLGGTAHQPSLAQPQTLVVQPALVPGEVLINGGASTTDDPYVTVEVPAVGAVAVQLSTDLDNVMRLTPPADWQATTTIRLTDPTYGDDQDGLRTVWVRWADAKNRWSEWRSDSITLDRGLTSGTVMINGGASQTRSHDVTAAVPVDEPAAVVSVELSNDGRTWQSLPYASSTAWRLAAGDGQRTVHVRWLDAQGRQSVGATDSILVDTRPPTISDVSARFVMGASPGGSVPVRIGWAGEDAGVGVAGYDVGVSRDGGSWSKIATSATGTSVVRSLALGHSYRFRVRGTDRLGNRSTWQLSSTVRLSGVQEKSAQIAYRGTWSRVFASSYWRGATKYATRSLASATLTFNRASIAWVSAVGPTRGSAKVYVDGTHVTTVELWASSKGSPRVVFERTWASAGSHTIRIDVVGTSGHPRIDIDGFLLMGPPK